MNAPDWQPPTPWISRTLLAINVALFLLLSGPTQRDVYAAMMLWPGGEWFRGWQLITHGFLHADTLHLAFNMLGLWQFGAEIERFLGGKRFLIVYFGAMLAAAAAQLAVSYLRGNTAPMVGASGAVFGLLYAYAACFPKAKITPLIPPIPLPAWLAVSLFGALELYLGLNRPGATIAHFAHLGGVIGAFLLLPMPWNRSAYAKLGQSFSERVRRDARRKSGDDVEN